MLERQNQDHQDHDQHQNPVNKEIDLLDYTKLTKDIADKTTIEDSVEVLILRIANEILAHPWDNDKNIELAAGLVNHIKPLSSAVVDNTK